MAESVNCQRCNAIYWWLQILAQWRLTFLCFLVGKRKGHGDPPAHESQSESWKNICHWILRKSYDILIIKNLILHKNNWVLIEIYGRQNFAGLENVWMLWCGEWERLIFPSVILNYLDSNHDLKKKKKTRHRISK